MRAYERMLEYVKVHTMSDPECTAAPSSQRQFDLAYKLVEEMKLLGIENPHVDEFGVVYGWLSATPGCEDVPALGFIAHMDTAPDFSGENVKPQIIENYDGGDVLLAGSGDVLSVSQFPLLKNRRGMTLITTDGTTLLGADDKAGIAEILTAVENIKSAGTPHGKICIAFTPDEEVGAGVDHFDVEKFGAVWAYTVDGGEEGEIAYETFNACSAHVEFAGLSVHPGSSKDTMINAALVAMEFNSLLPAADIPQPAGQERAPSPLQGNGARFLTDCPPDGGRPPGYSPAGWPDSAAHGPRRWRRTRRRNPQPVRSGPR